MHSIKKVEESARIAREAHRQKKCREVDALRKKIFELYKNIDGRETEFLDLSAVLLESIPDFYTFWIMRRNVLLKIQSSKEKPLNATAEEELELSKADDDLFNCDLKLSEKALLRNPKSYSAWNHRRFLMKLHPNPPLQRELVICETALIYDSRNFHVWDYRRFIVRLLNHTMEEELEFSKKMVEQNPSNYSAWHYRINILLEAGDEITDELFIEEIKNVTEVCVVNSEDQTAWTYVNWLIDRFFNQKATKMGLENVISFTDNDMVDGNYHSTLVLFNSCTTDGLKEFIEVDNDNQEWQPRGKTTFNSLNISSRIWDIYSKTPINIFNSSLKETSKFSLIQSPKRRYVNTVLLNEIYSPNPKQMAPEVKECLKTLFDVCQELMKENNETNPWEISLSACILPLISGINDETEKEVKELLKKAKICDPQRREMYDSTENKIILINFLNQKNDECTVLETLFKKEGKICLEFNDYSCLRPLAGLVRVYSPSIDDLPFVNQAELRWFLPVIAN